MKSKNICSFGIILLLTAILISYSQPAFAGSILSYLAPGIGGKGGGNITKQLKQAIVGHPGMTAGLTTGDPIIAGQVHNMGTMLNPHSDTKGTDAFFSGSFITDPGGYHATTFLSGSSGEKKNLKGLVNYTRRVTTGTAAGIGQGAARGFRFGGPWGAIGGAVTEGAVGGMVGSLTGQQTNKLTDDMALGNDNLKKLPIGPIEDVRNFHGVSMEKNLLGAYHQSFGRRILITWASIIGGKIGAQQGVKGIEQFEADGWTFPAWFKAFTYKGAGIPLPK
ncbi:MAG: hypothetical protein ABSB18_05555 [Candidatus Omnitrophota bacterium]